MKKDFEIKLNYRIKRFILEDPMYVESKLKSFKNNPLTEAMPRRVKTKEIFEMVLFKAPYHEERDEDGDLSIKDLEFEDKAQLSIHISDFSLPETNSWFAFYMDLYRIIFDGYKSRSPFSADGERVKTTLAVNKGKDYEAVVHILREMRTCNTTSKTSMLSGPSGTGKTHRAEQILSLIPNVIRHTKYKKKKVRFTQLSWVKIDCPAGGSEKGVCLYFFAMLDYLLGLSGKDRYYQDSTFRKSLDTLQLDMAIAVATYNIGLIVIDEMQNLLECSTSSRIMRFLDTLVNVVGVPILYIGTSRIYKLFCPETVKSFRTVRRIATGFYYEIDRYQPDDSFWQEMVLVYWSNLLCINESDPSDEIFAYIYKKTQGVPAILEYLMTRVNTYVADNSIEVVDKKLISDIYKTQLIPLHDAVNALACDDKNTYDDLYPISKLLMDGDEDSSTQSTTTTSSATKGASEVPKSKNCDEGADEIALDPQKEMADLESLFPD